MRSIRRCLYSHFRSKWVTSGWTKNLVTFERKTIELFVNKCPYKESTAAPLAGAALKCEYLHSAVPLAMKNIFKSHAAQWIARTRLLSLPFCLCDEIYYLPYCHLPTTSMNPATISVWKDCSADTSQLYVSDKDGWTLSIVNIVSLDLFCWKKERKKRLIDFEYRHVIRKFTLLCFLHNLIIEGWAEVCSSVQSFHKIGFHLLDFFFLILRENTGSLDWEIRRFIYENFGIYVELMAKKYIFQFGR